MDVNEGRIRRADSNGADLTQLVPSKIAYNGGLLSLMLGVDGFMYVSNAIFKVVSP